MGEVSLMPPLVPEPALDPVILGGALDNAFLGAADHLDDTKHPAAAAAPRIGHKGDRSHEQNHDQSTRGQKEHRYPRVCTTAVQHSNTC